MCRLNFLMKFKLTNKCGSSLMQVYNNLILLINEKIKALVNASGDPAGGQPFEKVAKQIEAASVFNQPVCPDF